MKIDIELLRTVTNKFYKEEAKKINRTEFHADLRLARLDQDKISDLKIIDEVEGLAKDMVELKRLKLID